MQLIVLEVLGFVEGNWSLGGRGYQLASLLVH